MQIQEGIKRMNSYPKIYNLGHKYISDLLLDEVSVQEKIDGSQISFELTDEGYLIKSKRAILNVDVPPNMFSKGVDVIKKLDLTKGWVYRGEYLRIPKHNTLAYDRIPKNHIILFDVNTGLENYLSYPELLEEGKRIGLEVVPEFFKGKIKDIQFFRSFLENVSILGGQKIEGVVIKNYNRFGIDGNALMGKFVSEAFKEVHGASWRESNPNPTDIIQKIIEAHKTPARWAKALQHLREAGTLEDSPKDIGLLIKEIQNDVKEECLDSIVQILLDWALPKINRGVISGFPEWYKEELVKLQFEREDAVTK